ncbi:GMNN [Acanthosepion pharaonis]|uniref:GMNN n=1 Tax=Acanthosepion pharaonis TaxID=158019 RepID=A0A812EJW6_ACAPH|nr:unnamed protein product [Sepia pharaonis]CAE1323944.1 GMNN [Sepia pharaonis]
MAKNKRISLQSLQPSATVGSNELVGKTSLINTVKGSKKTGKAPTKQPKNGSQKSINHFYDSKSDKTRASDKSLLDKENRTQDTEKEAYELMCSGKVSENYWKEFAEQRREALVEVMEENKKLHEENFQLKKEKEKLLAENEELKEENERLTLYVSKADELTKFLESITEDSS